MGRQGLALRGALVSEVWVEGFIGLGVQGLGAQVKDLWFGVLGFRGWIGHRAQGLARFWGMGFRAWARIRHVILATRGVGFRLVAFGFSVEVFRLEVISSVYRRIKKEAWLLNQDVRWIIKVQDGGSRLEDVSFPGSGLGEESYGSKASGLGPKFRIRI